MSDTTLSLYGRFLTDNELAEAPSLITGRLIVSRFAAGGLSLASPVRLLVDHDPGHVLADTSDGSLVIWQCGADHYWAVPHTTARGRAAILYAGDHPHLRQCSAGTRCRGWSDEGLGIVRQTAFELYEISLCRWAAPSTGGRKFVSVGSIQLPTAHRPAGQTSVETRTPLAPVGRL